MTPEQFQQWMVTQFQALAGQVADLQAERSAILIGVALSVVILGLMGSQFMAASSVPPIHNISTDTDDSSLVEVF